MITFDDLGSTPTSGQTIEGAFSCHECGEYVITATLNKKSGILRWTCSNNHKSEIEWNL